MGRRRTARKRARVTTVALTVLAAAAIITSDAVTVTAGAPAAAGPVRPGGPGGTVPRGWAVTPAPVVTPAPAGSLPAAAGLRAYRNSGTGATFTEGDGTYALHLLDGRVVWFFSDSFLGAVSPDGGRGPSAMLHNQIVVQDSPAATGASSFHNVWPNGWGTNSFAAAGCMAEWPAAAIQPALNQVEVVLRCVDAIGHVVRLDLATVTINSGFTGWTVSLGTPGFDSAARVQGLSCAPEPGYAQAEFGQSIVQLPGVTYIYGLQRCPHAVRAYVARVAGSDISRTGLWQYWDGTGRGWADGWAGGEYRAAPMTSGRGPLIHAGSEYSVVHDVKRGVYRLIASDLGHGPVIDEYTATVGPAGPWIFRGTIDSTLADGIYGRRPAGDPQSLCRLTTYGAKEQPVLEAHADIVFSYNVNVVGCPVPDAWAAYQASLANYNPQFRYACGPRLPLVPRLCAGAGRRRS